MPLSVPRLYTTPKTERSAVPPSLVTLWLVGWVGGKGELEGVCVRWTVLLDVRVRWVGSGAQLVD